MITALVLLVVAVALLAAALMTTVIQNSTTNGRPPARGRPPLPYVPAAPAAPQNDLINATAKYRPKNGVGDYLFRFHEFSPASFRIYVLQQPDRGEQNHEALPHLLSDATGPYLCWTIPITTYEDAKEIAARWAEGIEEFRETGKMF